MDTISVLSAITVSSHNEVICYCCKRQKENRTLLHRKQFQYVQENTMSRRKIKNNARLPRLICFVRCTNTQKPAQS